MNPSFEDCRPEDAFISYLDKCPLPCCSNGFFGATGPTILEGGGEDSEQARSPTSLHGAFAIYSVGEEIIAIGRE